MLDELELRYEAHDANAPVHTFARREDVIEWVEGFHGLPEERRGDLRRVLTPFIEEQGGNSGCQRSRHGGGQRVRRATP